ncbi:unnamed protein product [Caenorhabditis auriculariae]|uniref:Galectin n=1 Tax=Caenorhabditis auriculariae TaxID=2777116 RepID=A0A8S1H1F0_9PELO|nr:unnamed protein product [Caenorhabditis auriculariae]
MKLLVAFIGFLTLADAIYFSCSKWDCPANSMQNLHWWGGMIVGDAFRIRAYAQDDITRKYITINFYEGQSPGLYTTNYVPRNIPLSVLINLETQITSLNSFTVSGGWSNEEGKKSSIKKGRDFEIYILAGERGYVISINGKFFATYKYPKGSKTYGTFIGVRGPLQFPGATKSCNFGNVGDLGKPHEKQLMTLEDGLIYYFKLPTTAYASATLEKKHGHE